MAMRLFERLLKTGAKVSAPGRSANPRRNGRFTLHRAHLAQSVALERSFGLEIGAQDLPFVENGEGICEFADYRTNDELRTLTASQGGHNVDYLAPVTYDLREGYAAIENRYDWIAASHVIEHVPDVIGWLSTLHGLLKPDGIVFLVVPDKRFTFDRFRRLTDMTDFVIAHEEKPERPTPRQVFDHYYLSTDTVDPRRWWKGTARAEPHRDLYSALMRARSAADQYEDAHCSVFTPQSFSELMQELHQLKLCPMRVADIRPTQMNEMDFSVILR